MNSELSILLLSVGNTRTAIALASDQTVERVQRLPNSDLDAIVTAVESLAGDLAGAEPVLYVASVNPNVSDSLIKQIATAMSVEIRRIGSDLTIPIGIRLDPEARTGQDRLLNAAAAYDRFRQACVIVDAGTAVTIDFVDGEGTFHGGAIAPGAQMQLNALHDSTAVLPQVAFAAPLQEPFGANTQQAMLQGVFHGIRGATRQLAEQYALAYGAYPIIIATGGDAHLLFDEDELIEHVVDDLALHGMLAAHRFARSADDEHES